MEEVDDDDADPDADGDSDGDGDIRDFRKRLRRKRDKERALRELANDAKNGTSLTTTIDAAAVDQSGEPGQEEGQMEFASDGTYRNKQRVLLFSSRGITSRFRHLLGDLRKLIPHHKKVQ